MRRIRRARGRLALCLLSNRALIPSSLDCFRAIHELVNGETPTASAAAVAADANDQLATVWREADPNLEGPVQVWPSVNIRSRRVEGNEGHSKRTPHTKLRKQLDNAFRLCGLGSSTHLRENVRSVEPWHRAARAGPTVGDVLLWPIRWRHLMIVCARRGRPPL